jgi:hypothetical protein
MSRFKGVRTRVGERLRTTAHELAAQADKLYGDALPQEETKYSVDEPIIYEYDTSNRDGIYSYKSSYWGRGMRQWEGPPTHGRQYVFPVPILDNRFGRYHLDKNYPDTLPHDHPVIKLGRYMMRNMRGDIAEVVLEGNTLDVPISPRLDAIWRREPPEDFHDRLSALVLETHPELPHCPVVQAPIDNPPNS